MKDIGEMDRRIKLYERTITTNSYGEEINTWSLYNTVWAKYEPIGGDEPLQDGTLQSTSLAKYTIRYDNAVTQDMVVVYDPENILSSAFSGGFSGDLRTTVWDIKRVDQVGREHFLELFCEFKALSTL